MEKEFSRELNELLYRKKRKKRLQNPKRFIWIHFDPYPPRYLKAREKFVIKMLITF